MAAWASKAIDAVSWVLRTPCGPSAMRSVSSGVTNGGYEREASATGPKTVR